MRALVLWLGFGFVALELLGFSMFVSRFGFMWLVVEIFLTGILGLRFLSAALSRLNLALNELLISLTQESIFSLLSRSMLGVFGAFLLLLPGIFSDIMGAVCLLSGALLAKSTKTSTQDSASWDSAFAAHLRNQGYQNNMRQNDNDEIIDVEVLDSTQEKKS